MKIQKCPECKPLQLATVVRLLLVLMTLALGYSFYAQVRDANCLAKTKDYQANRQEILEKIQRSIRTENWTRLQRIERKYGVVKDPELVTALRDAKASIQEKMARKTLAAGKVMDIRRQQESDHSAAIRPVSLSSEVTSD